MKLLTLNIQHGGRSRAERILDFIRAEQPDVVVLTEYRNNEPGTRLIDGLAALGLQCERHDRAPPKTNSVLLAARAPIRSIEGFESLSSDHVHRVVLADVDGTLVCAAYFPLDKVKVRFWRDDFLPLVARFAARPSVLIGDFNTGQHLIDEAGRTFFGAQYLDELRRGGWVDAWRSLHQDAREYSWYSKAGNGFRVDHCWLSAPLRPRLVEARYVHDTRLQGTSDHSALVVTLSAR